MGPMIFSRSRISNGLNKIKHCNFDTEPRRSLTTPMGQEIDYGELATFNCTAVGSNIRVSWQFNGNAIEPSSLDINGNNSINNHTISSTLTINTTTHINLLNNVLDYSRTVQCIIHQMTEEFDLQGQDPEIFLVNLDVKARLPQVTVNELNNEDVDNTNIGDELLILSPLIIIDYGSPRADVNWFHNGMELTPDSEGVQILDSGSLMVRNIVAGDRGDYVVVVSNFFAEVMSRSVGVTVNCK